MNEGRGVVLYPNLANLRESLDADKSRDMVSRQLVLDKDCYHSCESRSTSVFSRNSSVRIDSQLND